MALAALRQTRGLSYKDISDRTGASKGTVADWEAGKAYPSGLQIRKLYSSIRELYAYEHLLRQERTTAKEEGKAVPPDTEPELAEPTDFPSAMRYHRDKADMSQEEVANLVGVTGGAVGLWERGLTTPMYAAWSKLVETFPDIAKFEPQTKTGELRGSRTAERKAARELRETTKPAWAEEREQASVHRLVTVVEPPQQPVIVPALPPPPPPEPKALAPVPPPPPAADYADLGAQLGKAMRDAATARRRVQELERLLTDAKETLQIAQQYEADALGALQAASEAE